MPDIIARSLTGSTLATPELNIPDAAIPISGSSVTLTDFNFVEEIQKDPDLFTYVSSSLLVLDDGVRELTRQESLNTLTPLTLGFGSGENNRLVMFNTGSNTLHGIPITSDVSGNLTLSTGSVFGNLVGTFTGSLSGALHSQLGGLTADDHTQYFNLNGRSGGQSAFGGTAVADDLTLTANTVNTGAGRIRVNTPMVFGPYSGIAGAQYGFDYPITTVESFTSAFIGGGLNFSGDVTFSNGVFIYESFRGAPDITTAATPTFAAYTVMQALPRLFGGSVAAHPPLTPLVLNAGPQIINATAGVTQTAGGCNVVNGAPSIRTTAGGGCTLNASQFNGFVWAPAYSTVAGSVVNFGAITGFKCNTPTVALFGSAAGVETMTSYYAFDVADLGTFGGNAPVAALRSAITTGTNQSFLLNDGGANSDFGGGNLLDCGQVQILADSIGVALGAGGADVLLNWNGSAYEWEPLSGTDVRWSFGTDVLTLALENFGAGASEFRIGADKFAFGQIGAVGNQVGIFVAPARSTSVAGGWSDFLLTQAANLTVNHAMSQVYGWTINAPSMTIGGGGSVTDAGALLVGGNVNSGTNRYGLYILSNPSGGGGLNHSLRVAGSALFDSSVEIDGDLDHDGTNVGFYGTTPVAQSAAYSVSNVTTDRTYDANSTTINELADVLGTLIADLQATGLIG